MLHSDKNMRKLKCSNKSFDVKKEVSWKNGISKKQKYKKCFLHKEKDF